MGANTASTLSTGEEQRVDVLSCEHGRGEGRDPVCFRPAGVHRSGACRADPGMTRHVLAVVDEPLDDELRRHGKGSNVLLRGRRRHPAPLSAAPHHRGLHRDHLLRPWTSLNVAFLSPVRVILRPLDSRGRGGRV
ncbi:unnamed protein product [Ectocarpus sp. 6 AP-2014]